MQKQPELIRIQAQHIGLDARIALYDGAQAFGGIRRQAYENEEAADAEAFALAKAMHLKCAIAGLNAAGAKAVIRDLGAPWPPIYRALAEAIESLGGRYICGPDLGTAQAQLDVLRSHTAYINPVQNDAGASTARGVMAGIRAVRRHLALAPECTIAIQGLGEVGLPLASALRSQGARVLGADIDPKRTAKLPSACILAPSDILSADCDILAPCAGSAVISQDTPLRCRAICGSANNPLAQETHAKLAEQLHSESILYAPDFVVNAGAVIEGVLTVQDPLCNSTVVQNAIDRIEVTLSNLLTRAKAQKLSPIQIAVQTALDRLR